MPDHIASEIAAEVEGAFERVRAREIDREFLPQEHLDVVSRDRVSAFPWRGQFTPNLVGALLDSYGYRGAIALDPFAGSGTTLIEAARKGMAAIGAEVNPAAIELARVFTLVGQSPASRRNALAQARRRLGNCLLQGDASLFASGPGDLSSDVVRAYADCPSPQAANLIAVSMMLAMGDGATLRADRLRRAFAQVTQVLEHLPAETTSCSVHAADARELPVPEDSVDLVITSPPYINVFNYHQNYRRATEKLGWHVLSAARSEIGSNRKHRQNRFLTVIQYAIDMMLALQECQRVCRPGAKVVIVLGRESTVRGVSFANGEIVGCLAELTCGIGFLRWQERSFVNRFGEKIYEEILAFEVFSAKEEPDSLVTAAEVGRQILVRGRPQAGSAEIAAEIDAAARQSTAVAPSPRFVPLRTAPGQRPG